MTQPSTNWLRPPKAKRESQHPEMKGRMKAARKVEKKKDFSGSALSDQDHFNQIWKELEA